MCLSVSAASMESQSKLGMSGMSICFHSVGTAWHCLALLASFIVHQTRQHAFCWPIVNVTKDDGELLDQFCGVAMLYQATLTTLECKVCVRDVVLKPQSTADSPCLLCCADVCLAVPVKGRG